MSIWRPVADALIATLFAPPCATCGTILDAPLGGAVCPSCWAIIDRLVPHRFAIPPAIRDAMALGEYDGVLRDAIHALKYDGRRTIGSGLSRIIAKHAHPLLQDADVVVPVPLHRSRERERGFNQSDTLAGSLALPARRVLRRIRSTPPQVDLTAQERRQNVAEAFVVTPSRGMEPNGKVLVLVDDVTTTGATLEACARVLLAAGAREVRAITAARVSTAPR